LAASLAAGHGFSFALEGVADDAPEPVSGEFRRVLPEARLGRPIEDALAGLAERTGSRDFEFVLTAFALQRETGSSLATLLELAAETTRERQSFARRLRVLTAMGRTSAYVLAIFPFVVALLISLLDPAYMQP